MNATETRESAFNNMVYEAKTTDNVTGTEIFFGLGYCLPLTATGTDYLTPIERTNSATQTACLSFFSDKTFCLHCPVNTYIDKNGNCETDIT